MTYELTPGDLVAKWFTFSAQKNDCDLTLDVLDDFNKVLAFTYCFIVLALSCVSLGPPALCNSAVSFDKMICMFIKAFFLL